MYSKLFSRAICSSVLAISFYGMAQDNVEKPKTEEPKVAEPAKEAPAAEDISNVVNKVSFTQGFYMGQQIKNIKEFVNVEEFIKGLKAAINDEKNPITEAEARAMMQILQMKMQEAEAKKAEAEKVENIKWISAFLEEKLEKTASGLEYKVLKMGEGAKPKATDYVTVHYSGYLTDGSKFDSSVDRGTPASFPLDGVIKGWTEGVQLMPIGSKFRFKIPSELGYGSTGSQGRIPPNAVLVFDIELIAIEK